LVAKGYLDGSDFHEIFSPIVKLVSIHVVLALVVLLDLELGKLDVKIVLQGVLDQEMYMEQPKRLVQDRNRIFFCKLKEVIVWPEACQENGTRS
jgi:hypothetical protein